MNHELALMAAQEWARFNATAGVDPVEFGVRTAQVYLAAQLVESRADDFAATAASPAESAAPAEKLPGLARSLELLSRCAAGWSRTGCPDAGSASS